MDYCLFIWTIFILIKVSTLSLVSCNAGYNKSIGVLIIDNDEVAIEGANTMITRLVDKYHRQVNFRLTLHYVPSIWKMLNPGMSCENYEVILLINTDCNAVSGIQSICNKPHLCISEHITPVRDTPSTHTLMYYYPSAKRAVEFLKQQIQLQSWKKTDINVIISGDSEFLSEEFIEVLKVYENNIHLYHVDHDLYKTDSLLKTIFNKTAYLLNEDNGGINDPKTIILGNITNTLQMFKQLKLLIDNGTVINHFLSQWLIFTTDNVQEILQLLDQTIHDSNIHGLSIMEVKDVKLNRESLLKDVLDMLNIYAENRTTWDLYNGTWCPNYICNTSVADTTSVNCETLTLSHNKFQTLLSDLPQTSVCTPFSLYVISMTSGRPTLQRTNVCSKNKKDWVKQDAFPVQKLGLNEKHFTITTLESAPFVMRAANGSGYYGICMDLLRELAIMMNFTYTLKRSPDGEFGVIKNNSWTGMIGALLKNEAQLAVASLTASPSRKTVVDFIHYFREYGGVMVKVPQREENAYRVIVQPFHWSLWVAIIVSVPVAGVVTWWFSIMLTKGLNKSPETFDRYEDSLWYTVGAILTQGGDPPKHFPTRTFIGCWWIFAIVIVAAYGGSLYTFLTINLNKVPFETGEQMVQSSYTWGTSGGSFYLNELSESNDTVLRAIGTGIKEFAKTDPEVLSKSKDDHFAKVKRGGYAFISDVTILQRQAASDLSCSISVLKKFKFLPLHLGIAIQKGSPYKRYFAKSVSQLQSSGLLAVWQNKWWPNDGCKGVYLADAGAITLLDMQSSFYLLFVGIFVAFLSITAEYFMKRSSLLKKLLPF